MGCGIACLAMVMGHTYDAIRKGFSTDELWDDGVKIGKIENFLHENGYAIRRLEWRRGRRWPPRPFADLHIAFVTPDPYENDGHCVVWLRNGTVLDPGQKEPMKLSDYFGVREVTGVFRLD
jgi:hypothetical protein